jgi:hypothetical protein
MNIPGAMAAALVNMPSGMALGKAGNAAGLDLDAAAAGNTEVVRAKLNTMQSLGIKGEIEDILITLNTQYHIIRPLGLDTTVFLYLVLNKAQANLAMARRTMQKIEGALVV